MLIHTDYRGVSMVDITAKVFDAILLKRFHPERDQRTCFNQCGFRPGRGCTELIHSLRRTLELH